MSKREVYLLLDDMLEWAHNILSFLLLSTITFFVFFATSLSLLCNSMGAIAQSSTKVFHKDFHGTSKLPTKRQNVMHPLESAIEIKRRKIQ